MHAGVHASAPEPSPANRVDFAGRLTKQSKPTLRPPQGALVQPPSKSSRGAMDLLEAKGRAECKFYVPCSLDHNLQILRVVLGTMFVSASET